MWFSTVVTIYHAALPTGGTGGGLGIFPSTTNTQLQQQQQQQLQLQQDQRLMRQIAIKAPVVFGDERDQTLVKFNMLQACCGTGKGLVIYNGQPQTVDFTTDSPVCRFKVHLGSCGNGHHSHKLHFQRGVFFPFRPSATTASQLIRTKMDLSPCSSRSLTVSC